MIVVSEEGGCAKRINFLFFTVSVAIAGVVAQWLWLRSAEYKVQGSNPLRANGRYLTELGQRTGHIAL